MHGKAAVVNVGTGGAEGLGVGWVGALSFFSAHPQLIQIIPELARHGSEYYGVHHTTLLFPLLFMLGLCMCGCASIRGTSNENH